MKKMFYLIGLLLAMVLFTNAYVYKDFDVGVEESTYVIADVAADQADLPVFEVSNLFIMSIEKIKEVAILPYLKDNESYINNLIFKNTGKSDYDIKEAITTNAHYCKRGSFGEINKIVTHRLVNNTEASVNKNMFDSINKLLTFHAAIGGTRLTSILT